MKGSPSGNDWLLTAKALAEEMDSKPWRREGLTAEEYLERRSVDTRLPVPRMRSIMGTYRRLKLHLPADTLAAILKPGVTLPREHLQKIARLYPLQPVAAADALRQTLEGTARVSHIDLLLRDAKGGVPSRRVDGFLSALSAYVTGLAAASADPAVAVRDLGTHLDAVGCRLPEHVMVHLGDAGAVAAMEGFQAVGVLFPEGLLSTVEKVAHRARFFARYHIVVDGSSAEAHERAAEMAGLLDLAGAGAVGILAHAEGGFLNVREAADGGDAALQRQLCESVATAIASSPSLRARVAETQTLRQGLAAGGRANRVTRPGRSPK